MKLRLDAGRPSPLGIFTGAALVVFLAGCTPSATMTAGPATPVVPAGVTPAPSSAMPRWRPGDATPSPSESSVPTPTSTTSTPSAPPSGMGVVSAAAAGPFALGKSYAVSTPTPGSSQNPTASARWVDDCKAWAFPDGKNAQAIAMPAKTEPNQPIAAIVALGAGAQGPTGIGVGSTVKDLLEKHPDARAVQTDSAWEVLDGGTRYVYRSWDNGKTLGSIEISPSASALALMAQQNPCG